MDITRDMEGIERIRDAPAHGGKPPEQMSPQELHSVLWQVLSFRDSGPSVSSPLNKNLSLVFFLMSPVVKKIEITIGRPYVDQRAACLVDNDIGFSEKIPGLGSLIEKIKDSISSE